MGHGRGAATARVVRYRARVTVARAWLSWLGVVVLVGLLGGVAMASVAAARRTQASYPTFLASTNPSDLTASIYGLQTGNSTTSILPVLKGDPGLVRTVRVVEVAHVAPIGPNGAPELAQLSDVNFVTSLDGEFSRQDRITIVAGHAADPRAPDELVLDANAARIFGVHLGSTMTLGMYSPAQHNEVNSGRIPILKANQRVEARVVGLAVLNNSVVQDDIDRAYGTVFVTPALLHLDARIDPTTLKPVAYSMQLTGGAHGVLAAEQLINQHLPAGATVEFHVTSRVVNQVELALRPESVAIGAFGVIAALACLVLALQAITRLLREGDADRVVLRALGATRRTVAADGLPGVLLAVVAGAVVAVGVAVPSRRSRRSDPCGPSTLTAASPRTGRSSSVARRSSSWSSLPAGSAGPSSRRRPAQRSAARRGRRRLARAAESAGLPGSVRRGRALRARVRVAARTSVPLRSMLGGHRGRRHAGGRRRSRSRAASRRSCRTRRSTGGTGPTASLRRPTTCRPRRSSCSTTIPTSRRGQATTTTT